MTAKSGAESKPKCGEAKRLPSSAVELGETSSSERAANKPSPATKGRARAIRMAPKGGPSTSQAADLVSCASPELWMTTADREELRELTTRSPSGGETDARGSA